MRIAAAASVVILFRKEGGALLSSGFPEVKSRGRSNADMKIKQGMNPASRRKLSESGFSLIELLIVVAIILIVAGIAIPSLLHARIAANEAAAGQTVRTITSAAIAYSSTWQNGYPPTLATLGGPASSAATCIAAGLLDPVIASVPNQKAGFVFAYTAVGAAVTAPPGCVAGANAYLVTATPVAEYLTGIRSFCSDEPGVIHYDASGFLAGSQAACEALPSLQ
jgi:type IV pilus assembly protein PilA